MKNNAVAWFEVTSSRVSDAPIQADESVEATIERGLACGTCYTPFSQTRQRIDIVLTRQPRTLFVPTYFVEVIRADVFAVIRPHLRGCIVGRCSVQRANATPKVCEDYVSCYSTRRCSLELHGWSDSRFCVCKECGSIDMTYSGIPPRSEDGSYYAVEADLFRRRAYQIGVRGSFVIHAELVEEIEAIAHPDLLLLPLNVRSIAMDVDVRPDGRTPNIEYR